MVLCPTSQTIVQHLRQWDYACFSNHGIVLHTTLHELVLCNSDLGCPHLGSGERSASQTMSFSDYGLTLCISDRISDHFKTLDLEMSWACVYISDPEPTHRISVLDFL